MIVTAATALATYSGSPEKSVPADLSAYVIPHVPTAESPHRVYKRAIRNGITQGWKKAAEKFVCDDSGPPLTQKAKKLANQIKQAPNRLTMGDINPLTEEIRQMCNECLKIPAEERDPAVFSFLKELAKVRMASDGQEATLEYGQKKNQASNLTDFADSWEKELDSPDWKFHRNSWMGTVAWTIKNPGHLCHAIASSLDKPTDKEPHIFYDALSRNPSFIAHEVNGLPFVHSPTPSAPDRSPIFRMYLESLKTDNQQHLHFQFQNPDKKDELARIQQMDGIAREYKETFQQVVLNFDALHMPRGKEILDAFITTGDICRFFSEYKTWVMENIRTTDPNQPITIPEESFNDEQIKLAFFSAQSICSDNDAPPPERREEFAQVMQFVLYSVLMTGIVQKRKGFISGGCKQDVDRGPVLNLALSLFSTLATKKKLEPDDYAKLRATATGRPQIGDNRHIMNERARHGINLLRFIAEKEDTIGDTLQSYIQSL